MGIKRLYNGSDNYINERLETLLSAFEKHQSDFETFDASLDATFLNNWKNASPFTTHTASDTTEVAEEQSLRSKALTALDKCRAKYKDVKYFAGKAFPKNKEVLKEFGAVYYSKVRASALDMVQFMETLFGVATKYKTALINAGFSQADIDEITTLKDELRAYNNTQQLKKKERPTQTRQRIEKQNIFYSYGQQVAAVAALIYSNDPARRNMFRLAVLHSHRPQKKSLHINGAATRKIKMPDEPGNFALTITNTGFQPIEYWQADKIREAVAQKLLLSPATSAEITAQLPAKKFLMIRNTATRQIKVVWVKQKKENPQTP